MYVQACFRKSDLNLLVVGFCEEDVEKPYVRRILNPTKVQQMFG